MKNIELKIIIGIALAIFLVVVFRPASDLDLGTLTGLKNAFTGNATNTSSTITTTSKEILARNVDRMYAAIVNDGANVIYLALADDATASSTVNQGIRLNANGGTIEFDNNMPYAGSVQALTASGTSTVTITRY